jgi:SAM-dependent methyltransferase
MNDSAIAAALPLENPYGHTKKVRLMLDVIKRERGRRHGEPLNILDIGCGSGFAVTRFLASHGDNVLGLDFYPPNIAYANKNFANDRLSFACLDATELRDEGKRFEIIVLADVLEHLHEPGELLKLAHDLLAPDGLVIVTIPNGFGPFELESYIHRIRGLGWLLDRAFAAASTLADRSFAKGKWSELLSREPADLPYNSGSPHVQWFTQRRFRDLVANAGLKINKIVNLSVFSGPFSNYVFGPFVRACEINARLADRLPSALSSAWWMEISKAN